MKCPACQYEQNDNNSYCEKCGANMKPAASNPQQPPYSSNQNQSQGNQYNQNQYGQPNGNPYSQPNQNQYSQPNGDPFVQPTYYPTNDAAAASARKASKIMGIISMCLGIVGLVSACGGGFAYSIAALILGSIAKKKAASVNHVEKMANAGYTMGLIGTIVGPIVFVILMIFYFVYYAALMSYMLY